MAHYEILAVYDNANGAARCSAAPPWSLLPSVEKHLQPRLAGYPVELWQASSCSSMHKGARSITEKGFKDLLSRNLVQTFETVLGENLMGHSGGDGALVQLVQHSATAQCYQ